MLGILLFELLAGRPPFEAESTELLYEQIKKGISSVVFPPECRSASEIVRNLCHDSPEQRLRSPELYRDPWFLGFDWEGLRQQRLEPPRVPGVEGLRDRSNFRSCDLEDPPNVPYKSDGSGWDLAFEDTEEPVAPARLPNPATRAAPPSAMWAQRS